ncbi:YczE/YyaS/YitT family protein [Holdemanella porci]|uniref:YczE/YyaS/YitT family protein n=1 Tax=Holdemanella porci TaxID=2652276 RepID=UPI0022E2FE21|nr:DUF6198 family protein [Holdemanella porci]
MILNNKIKRIIVYIVGLFILALGLTLNTKANLGVSPIISVPYSISQITGLNFGDLTFIEYTLFVFIEVLIHLSEKNKARIISDLLQLPLSLIFTRLLNVFSAYIPTSDQFGIQLLILAMAIICTGVGAAMSLSMQFVPNPGDGIVQALAGKFNKSVGLTKNMFDCVSVCITLCISLIFAHTILAIGIGTVIAVLGVGRVIALFHHVFKSQIIGLIQE